MSKLLSANFDRLKRSKIFWICMAFLFAFGSFTVLTYYMTVRKYGFPIYLDNSLMIYTTFIGVLLAVFCSLFVGTEYSDGTIRNKLIVGHSRISVYLSYLVVCVVAGLLMCLAYLASILAIGIPLLGFFQMDLKWVCILTLTAFSLSIAFSALFTMLALLNQSKALVAVLSILGAFLLLFAGTYIYARLNEPEIFEGYSYTDDTGETITEEAQPNPNYLRGTQRRIYEFLYDFLPGGQATQLSNQSVEHPWRLILYSSVITVSTTGLGILFFRRKDLK